MKRRWRGAAARTAPSPRPTGSLPARPSQPYRERTPHLARRDGFVNFRIVKFKSSEDRLNPVTPEGVDDTTLGGYPLVHGRAVALEASDGWPYTVAVETEHDTSEDRDRPWAAYLVFIRWAQTGSAVMGHLETPDMARASTRDDAVAEVEKLELTRVKQILEDAIRRKREQEAEWNPEGRGSADAAGRGDSPADPRLRPAPWEREGYGDDE